MAAKPFSGETEATSQAITSSGNVVTLLDVASLFAKVILALSTVVLAITFLINRFVFHENWGAATEDVVTYGLDFPTWTLFVVLLSPLFMCDYRWRFSRWIRKHSEAHSKLNGLRFPWSAYFLAMWGSAPLAMSFWFFSLSFCLVTQSASGTFNFFAAVLLANIQSLLMAHSIRHRLEGQLLGLDLCDLIPTLGEDLRTIWMAMGASRTRSSGGSSSGSRGGGGRFSGGGASGRW